MRISLRVLTTTGQEAALTLDADSAAEAVRLAMQQGYQVQAWQLQAHPGSSRRDGFPRVLFVQELVALLEAGLNVVEALQALTQKEGRDDRREVMAALLSTVQEGRTLSQGMEAQSAIFPPLLIACVRSAEQTGDLAPALGRYAAHELQFLGLRQQLIAASIYPALLLCVGGLVALFLLGYVVPRFSVVFESSGRELPRLSELLLMFGRWVHAHWLWIPVVMAGIGGLIATLILSPHWRKGVLTRLLNLPGLRRPASKYRLAGFYRATGLLLQSGIPLVRALQLTAPLLGPEQDKLNQAISRIEEGQSFSAALSPNGLLTPVALSLVHVGEKAGRLGEMLTHAASFHEADLARWISWISRVAEPALMALIGLVIGVIVLLLYLPIFELAGSLQ